MKRLILLSVIFLCAPAWAATFACTTSGGTTTDFNTASTWTSCNSTFPQAPGANLYSATITSGKTIVCAIGATCAAGLSTAGAGTNDLIIQQGGTLTIGVGSNLNVYGDIEIDKGATFNATSSCGNISTITQFVPNAGTYKVAFPNTGTGASTLNYTGAAPSGARCDVVFFCSQTGTGTCSYAPTANADVSDNFSYVMFNHYGSASVTALTEPAMPNVRDISWNHVTFLNSGTIVLTRTSGTVNWNMSHIVAINGLTQANYMVFNDTTAQTGGVRKFDNIRIYNESSAVNPQVTINVKNAIVGQSVDAGDTSDVEGIVCYNCVSLNTVASSNINIRTNNSFFVQDDGTTSPLTILPDANQIWWNPIMLGISPNWHIQIQSGTDAALSDNIFQHPICDGDGTAQSDFGDFMQSLSTPNSQQVYRPMDLNNCGTMITTENTTSMKILNGLTYRAQGGSIEEAGTCSATSLTAWRNHIMVWPIDQINGNFNSAAYGVDGLHFNSAYNAASCQLSWGANTLGSNAYFMMPNSSDTINGNAAESLTTANGGNANTTQAPYINTIKSTSGGITGLANISSTAGTTTTHISCSTCDFVTAAVQAGSEVIGFTGAPNPRSVVQTVNDLHNVDLRFAIPSLTVGTKFSIGPSIYSNSSLYLGDANNLVGDLHIDPNMRNPDQATACYWLQLNGETVHCGTRTAGAQYNSTSGPFVLTSGTGTTTLVCSTCDFVTWNIQVGEPVSTYNGTTIRGRGTVVSRDSATQLTITSIASTASGDHFSFLDVTRAAARAALSNENLDQNGGYVAAKTWATQMNLRQYYDWNLTPMKGQLKNASYASDCAADPLLCDIGAVTVFNAASF